MDTVLELLVDFHKGAERQGPGGERETMRALRLSGLQKLQGELQIADIGCGSGASTLILARELAAKLTAVDLFPDFLATLQERAQQAGVAQKISCSSQDMKTLAFTPESLDAIWSEGAIYNVGFDAGIAAWKPFLKQGGILAVSDLIWLGTERPSEIESYWQHEYPGVSLASEKMHTLELQGFTVLGYFPLPASCWLQNYYLPAQTRYEAFLARYPGSDAEALVGAMRDEHSLYERYQACYSYGFFIAQKN